MRAGISLVEVIAALAIGSVMSLLLYRSLYQTNRAVQTVDALVDTHAELALCTERLTKDLNGAFIPVQTVKPASVAPQADKKPEASGIHVASKTSAQREEKSRQKQIEDIFVVNKLTQGERLASEGTILAFITSNPLVIYGEAPVRKVRVTYTLTLPKGERALRTLTRYESSEIDSKRFQDKLKRGIIKGYPVLHNIQNLTIECLAHKEEQHEGQAKQESKIPEQKTLSKGRAREAHKQETHKKEWERLNSWNDNERFKEHRNLLPDFIELKGTVLDARRARETSFSLLIPIASRVDPTQVSNVEQPFSPQEFIQQVLQSSPPARSTVTVSRTISQGGRI
jgi:hypothetical protein